MSEFFTKKNLPLLLALAIPVLMVIGVAAAVYLPGLGHSPSYNFLYISGQGVTPYGYDVNEYYVKDGHLVKEEKPLNPVPLNPVIDPNYKNRIGNAQIYLHDVKSNTSKEISFEEAQKLRLDSSTKSPDGYEVGRGGYNGGGFLFSGGGSDYTHWYIKGYNRSTQLDLKLSNGAYYDNFKFLGWIN